MRRNAAARTGRLSRAQPFSEMDAYDRLPPSIRHALRNSVCGWSAVKVWRAWEACHYRNAQEVVRLIRYWDRLELEDRADYLKEQYGVTRNEALSLCGIRRLHRKRGQVAP